MTNPWNFRFLLLLLLCPYTSWAEELNLVSALQNTYVACANISDSLSELKKMAGISTAISAVGTGVSTGALGVGIAKDKVDDKAERIEVKLEVLRKINETDPQRAEQDFTIMEAQIAAGPNYAAILKMADEFFGDQSDLKQLEEDLQKDLKELTDKSKKLGNWRTGLMGAGAAANVAGAIVSGVSNNKIKIEDLIAGCKASLSDLNRVIAQARLNNEDVTEAQLILDACSDYNIIDETKFTKIARGATITSAIGATAATTGTVLSAVSNSDKMRNDNTETGKEKEDKLNTASNVLAFGTAVSGVASTALSAVQIAELKKILSVSEKCTSVLMYDDGVR
jgi:hypothetical protein